MGMPAVDTFHTRDMVLALPDDGQRYETVHGELVVSPAPSLRHQEILRRLFRLVDAYVERTGVGRAMFSPADISWGPDVLVQPDLFVIAPADLGARDWTEVKRLALVVEIASPSTVRQDRFAKRRLYQEAGVPAYWVVDPDAQAVEVWTPDAVFPQVEHEGVTWHPAGAVEPFTLECAELFRPPNSSRTHSP